VESSTTVRVKILFLLARLFRRGVGCGCDVHRFEFRDKTFFLAHIVISVLLGVFVGGLYFHTGDSIAGFQSRVGVLFFLVRLRTRVV
jgi:hypothetical protein